MSIASLASWSVLVPVAAFLAAAIGVWAILSAFAESETDLDERLSACSANRGRRVPPGSAMKRQEKLQEKVANAASRLSGALKPDNPDELGKIRLKLLNAGFRGEQAVSVFLGLKCAGLLLGLGMSVPPVYARYGLGQTGLCLIGMIAGACFYLPGIIVGMICKKRQEQIFLGLPDALDLMVVCVEAGLGLDAAMRRVASEMVSDFPVLCGEFSLANFQIQMGRPPRDVLRDLGVRHRRGRPPVAGGRDHPGRAIRLQRRLGPADPVRRDAGPPPPARRGEGGQDGRQDYDPPDPLHLPRRLRRPGRPGGYPDRPEHGRGEVTVGPRLVAGAGSA